MSPLILLDWTFSPPDYFEEQIEVSHQDYTMAIADGQVQARVDSSLFEADPDMRQRLHDDLNDRFLGVQLLTNRAYKLSRSTKTRVYPDGRREIFIEVEPARIVLSAGTVDVQMKDKDGNVIVDSKRDRIERKKSLGELINMHRRTDALLSSLLESQAAAVRDPNNELVHLYEIRDALSTKFGGDSAARTALGIGNTPWSRFGQLCNSKSLRQGRHRGKTVGVLRNATEAELTEARAIARAMIKAYLRHLDASATP